MKMEAAPENREFISTVKSKVAPVLVVGENEYAGVSGVMKYIYEVKGWLQTE